MRSISMQPSELNEFLVAKWMWYQSIVSLKCPFFNDFFDSLNSIKLRQNIDENRFSVSSYSLPLLLSISYFLIRIYILNVRSEVRENVETFLWVLKETT